MPHGAFLRLAVPLQAFHVALPTVRDPSFNVAAAGSILMYDRYVKRQQGKVVPIGEAKKAYASQRSAVEQLEAASSGSRDREQQGGAAEAAQVQQQSTSSATPASLPETESPALPAGPEPRPLRRQPPPLRRQTSPPL